MVYTYLFIFIFLLKKVYSTKQMQNRTIGFLLKYGVLPCQYSMMTSVFYFLHKYNNAIPKVQSS
jgi:hypothetical protein